MWGMFGYCGNGSGEKIDEKLVNEKLLWLFINCFFDYRIRKNLCFEKLL